MDRLIQINVNGYTITKDHNCAGSQHESGATSLRITFSEDWKHYAKTVTFWNAKGTDSVKRILTTDLLENLAQDTNTYIAPIPGEAMTDAGWFSFVIDGYIDSSRQRTVEDKLKVLPSRKADDAGDPIDPTPTQAEQLQKQIDGIIEDIQIAEQAVEAAKEAIESAKAAEASENAAAGSAAAANASAQDAQAAALSAASSATQAESHKAAVETFATTAGNASSQAQSAAQSAAASATAAAKSATSAEGSASTAVTSATNAATSATNAARSESAAETAEANAKAAQAAAERARDAAQGIVGGDFSTREEAQGYANAAERNANAYTDKQIAGISTPDDKVSKSGDTMTGNLEISKGIPMLSFTVPGGEAYAEIKKNAGTSADMGININDFTSDGNYTQLNLSHKDKSFRLRVTENGVATGAYDIYHEGNKPTADDVGAVDKSGDTMTGTLQLQPTDSVGYAKIYKNADAEGDYGLQMQDVDPDGNFMGLTLSGKLQKLEFKKKKAGDTDYTYTKLYDTDNPPTAEEVGALDESGGTVYGNVNIQTDYGRLTIGASDTHKTELVKNGDSTDDYGTILRDTSGEAVAEIKLNAENGTVKLAKDGNEYVLYHEGNVDNIIAQAGGLKVETGQYSGSIGSVSTMDRASKSLTFNGVPVFIYICVDNSAASAVDIGKMGFLVGTPGGATLSLTGTNKTNELGYIGDVKVTVDGTTLTLTSVSSGGYGYGVMNYSQATYRYVAITQ